MVSAGVALIESVSCQVAAEKPEIAVDSEKRRVKKRTL
jgi:hypothetical protein